VYAVGVRSIVGATSMLKRTASRPSPLGYIGWAISTLETDASLTSTREVAQWLMTDAQSVFITIWPNIRCTSSHNCMSKEGTHTEYFASGFSLPPS
jgi:hypothetical protein